MGIIDNIISIFFYQLLNIHLEGRLKIELFWMKPVCIFKVKNKIKIESKEIKQLL